MTSRATRVTTDAFLELADERRLLAAWDDDVLRTQIEVSQIPAPTGGERERGAWMMDRFRGLGLHAVSDGEGNVIARTPGRRETRPVVVCAHLDTVFPAGTDVAVTRDGPRVVGPGIVDNGRGLAAMLALAAVLRRCDTALPTPVEFVATTGEEGAGDLRGARHYFSNSRPVAALILDGAGDERIVNTALGARRFRVEYRGPGGHSWGAFGAPNPVHAAARAVNAIADLSLPPNTTVSVGRIAGGVSVNSIPECAWFEVDARSTAAEALARVDREISAIASWSATRENERRNRRSEALRFRLERIGERPCGHTPAAEPLVMAAMEATRLVGRVPELCTASTDANAAIAVGAPAIAIGAGGRGGDAHSTREWFDNTGATAGVQRALTIVAAMARLAG